MPDIDTEELRRQGRALTYLETERVLDALDAKDREIAALRHARHPDASWTGADHRDLSDPAKRWRCDICGLEGTRAALEASEADRG